MGEVRRVRSSHDTASFWGGAFEHCNCSSACCVCLPCPGELRLVNLGQCSQSATSHCEVAQELDWHGPWLANVFRWVPVTAVAGHCRERCVCLVLNL